MDGIKKRSQQTFYDLGEKISWRRLLYLAVTVKNPLKVTILFLKPDFCIPYSYGTTLEHFKNTYYLYFLYGILARYKILKSDGKL